MPSRRRQKAVHNRSRPVRMVAPCASPRHSRRRNHPLPQRTRSHVGRSMRGTQCHRRTNRPDTSVPRADLSRLRVRGRLEDVEGNLRMLLRKKTEMGSSIFIQVQFVATPENRSKVELFESHWLAEPGVDQVELHHERTHAGQTVRHDQCQNREELRQPCRYWWESVVIMQDGTAVPCCKDVDAKAPPGNAFEQDLGEIWNGDVVQSMHRSHIDTNYDAISLCANCSGWQGEPVFPAKETEERVRGFAQLKSSFRDEPRHIRAWE